MGIGAILGAAGIGVDFLGGCFSLLYARASIIIAGVGAGVIVLERSGGLIGRRRIVNFNYIRTFGGMGALG